MNITDIHSHILPGIDDGSKNWEMSLSMVQKAWKRGVGTIVATPHYLPWEKKHNTAYVKQLCRELMLRARQQYDTEIQILPGQEIYFHQDILSGLEKGEILTLAGTRYILIEFDPDTASGQIFSGLKGLRNSGYCPILAHVERYTALRSPEKMQELKDEGIFLQMNYHSLCGSIFDSKTRWCRKCIKEGYIDFMASDMHNDTSRPPVRAEALQWLNTHVQSRQRRQLLAGFDKILNETKDKGVGNGK